MKLQHFGNIIKITSIGAKIKNPLFPVYGAYKEGIAHFSRCIADVLAREGIRVNCIGPGLTATGSSFSLYTKEMLNGMIPMIPLGRIGEAEDVANAYVFLASAEASYITGQHLTVDGGYGPY